MPNEHNKERQKAKSKSDAITDFAGLVEELASALVMALVIIGFVVQPFIIPTGSMAETLKGAHFRFYCPQCGYGYERDFQNRDNNVPSNKIFPPTSRCPSCGYYYDAQHPVAVAKGDKILALKCLYQFVEPKRWDVIVFKNPVNPQENYIKRLIGKPGETVEIIDGDIYIDGLIARKPPKVQDELWMVVYNSEYVPVRPDEPLFNGRHWEQPMRNYGDSRWRHKENGGGKFVLSDTSVKEHFLVYDTDIGNDFRATYAYDMVEEYSLLPICSDLMVNFTVKFEPDIAGSFIGAGLRKYQRYYKAVVDEDGRMKITRADDGSERVLIEKDINPPALDKSYDIEFANVDHKLRFKFGREILTYDLGRKPEDAGPYRAEAEPEVEIIGGGRLTVSHVGIYRDIHYLSKPIRQNFDAMQAVQSHPLTLEDDEFFVLGDNSPASLDGRWWNKPGIGNNEKSYTQGVVPRDYLMGKAFVVFWPSGFKPFEKFPFRIVPNIRELRLIYGGSDKKF